MHMKKLLLSIFALTSMLTVLGQDKTEYSLNCFAIYDYNLDAFLVIDDSATNNTHDSEGNTAHSYCFLSEKYSFEQFKTDFIALSIADQGVYFVHRGRWHDLPLEK